MILRPCMLLGMALTFLVCAVTAAHQTDVVTEQQSPAQSSQRPDFWIGYTAGRNDLAEGQWANWVTQRAQMVHAGRLDRQVFSTELTRQPFSWTQFAGWSPDGRQALIGKHSESPTNAAWEREHQTFRMTQGWLSDMCLVDLGSGVVTNVTAIDRVSNYNTGLFFLPNGAGFGFTPLINGVSRPYMMDLDGRNKRDMSQGSHGFAYGYSVSPDGQWISYHEDYQIFISQADGTGKRRVETGHPFNFAPRWSPNSEHVLFVSGEHYNCHPHVVGRDGQGLRKVADRGGYRGIVEPLKHADFHSGSSDLPIWSHDSQSIFFTAQVDGRVELMHATIDGRLTRLTHSAPNVRHYHPALSADGAWILFGSDRSGTMQLYVATTLGADAYAITAVPPDSCAMHGHWQPSPAKRR